MAASSEGKRLSSSSSKLCESCHIHPAIKYCAECPIHLCDICTRGHRNLKYTKDHVLSDIGASSKTPNSPSTTMRGCHKHNNKKFTTCCTECVQLICESCKSDHKGHDLMLLTPDAKLHQKVCSKNIQNLLDDLQEIDGIKTILEGHVTTYEDAINVVDNWELDLMQMVKNKAAKLRKKLKELKEAKYKQLSDKVKGTAAQLQLIDKAITNLSSIRKLTDIHMFENELSASQKLIDKLETYKLDLEPFPTTPRVENVLPNGCKMKEADDVLDVLFTAEELVCEKPKHQDHRVVAEWKFTASNGGKDISQYGQNPVELQNVSYGPGPRGEKSGAVILPTSHNQRIIVEVPTDLLRLPSEMTFFVHLYIYDSSAGPLLIVDGKNILNVENDSLQVQFTGPTVYVRNVLIPGSWHKIAVVWDTQKSNISIYINGTLVKSEQRIFDLSVMQRGYFRLGSHPSNKNFIKGRIASTKLFNVAVRKDEIQNM